MNIYVCVVVVGIVIVDSEYKRKNSGARFVCGNIGK